MTIRAETDPDDNMYKWAFWNGPDEINKELFNSVVVKNGQSLHVALCRFGIIQPKHIYNCAGKLEGGEIDGQTIGAGQLFNAQFPEGVTLKGE